LHCTCKCNSRELVRECKGSEVQKPPSDDNASASDNYASGEQNGASENNGEEETLQVLTTKETEDQSPADALVDNDTIATNEATSEPAAGNNNDDDDGDVSALTSQLKETTVE
jgi:hypothetical protein